MSNCISQSGKIVVAGSILVDHVNEIAAYPAAGELVQIRSVKRVPGGMVPNTGCDIRILDPSIKVVAAGAVGRDEDGAFVARALAAHGIELALTEADAPTSYTEVMSVPGGERTFFTNPGASAAWGYDDFPFAAVAPGDLVLLGYFLLLERIDAGDGLRILKELKRRGAATAIDMVTASAGRYAPIRECLAYVDNLIVNETEAWRLAGAEDSLEGLCGRLFELGVRERVIIHSPERSVYAARGETPVACESIRLPEGFIRDKTGAGDAFCAGALVSIFRGQDAAAVLHAGSLAAVGALSGCGATGGMRPFAELEALVANFTRS